MNPCDSWDRVERVAIIKSSAPEGDQEIHIYLYPGPEDGVTHITYKAYMEIMSQLGWRHDRYVSKHDDIYSKFEDNNE